MPDVGWLEGIEVGPHKTIRQAAIAFFNATNDDVESAVLVCSYGMRSEKGMTKKKKTYSISFNPPSGIPIKPPKKAVTTDAPNTLPASASAAQTPLLCM